MSSGYVEIIDIASNDLNDELAKIQKDASGKVKLGLVLVTVAGVIGLAGLPDPR